MSVLKRTCAKLLSVFRKTELDHDFDEEAQSHIALATDDSVQPGMPLAEAHRLARLRFGSIAASKDAHRDSRGLPWLDGFLFDSRLAVRGLRRDRAFALTSITLMALAIGLNVTVFTVMDAMLFRGYPLVNGNDRLVYLQEPRPRGRVASRTPISRIGAPRRNRFKGWPLSHRTGPSASATATVVRATCLRSG